MNHVIFDKQNISYLQDFFLITQITISTKIKDEIKGLLDKFKL